MKRIAVAVCLSLLCGAASAQTPSDLKAIDVRYKTCLVRANGVTQGLDLCNAAATAAADKILNRLYGGWADQLKHPAQGDAADSAEILKRLVAAERDWIGFRDTSCKLESTSMLGGTGESNVYGDCLYRMTRQRVLDLKKVQGDR